MLVKIMLAGQRIAIIAGWGWVVLLAIQLLRKMREPLSTPRVP